MKTMELIKKSHNVKVGDICPCIEPNITEDTMFLLDGEAVGFYIKNMTGKAKDFIDIANNEFLSDNVPKEMLRRSSEIKAHREGGKGVEQYSTIIGSVPPKAFVGRGYATISSVHQVKTAKTFIKSMLLLCLACEDIIKEIMPEQYNKQKEIIKKNVPSNFRFGNLFTSSISNYNVSADFHVDTRNLKNTVNVITTKRNNSTGGSLNVPDFDLTIEQTDNSLLVYPAWLTLHGVTPIETKDYKNGYRNSFIFYPLTGFKGL